VDVRGMRSGKANMAVVMTVVMTVTADGPTGDVPAHAAVPLPVPIAPFVPHCWYWCWYWCWCWCYCWQRGSFWTGSLPPLDTTCNKALLPASSDGAFTTLSGGH